MKEKDRSHPSFPEFERERRERFLTLLGFVRETDGVTYSKKYENHDGYVITAHTREGGNGKIDYGSDIQAVASVLNFSHPEYSVVLECVDRLLRTGYSPKNLIIEKEYKAERSRPRADICVKNDNDEEYALIECKTYGEEFEKELGQMKEDGGQLFSYFVLGGHKADVLILYTSTLKGEEISYEERIVPIKDEYRSGDAEDICKKWNKRRIRKSGFFEVEPFLFNGKKEKRADSPIPKMGGTRGEFYEIIKKIKDTGHGADKVFPISCWSFDGLIKEVERHEGHIASELVDIEVNHDLDSDAIVGGATVSYTSDCLPRVAFVLYRPYSVPTYSEETNNKLEANSHCLCFLTFSCCSEYPLSYRLFLPEMPTGVLKADYHNPFVIDLEYTHDGGGIHDFFSAQRFREASDFLYGRITELDGRLPTVMTKDELKEIAKIACRIKDSSTVYFTPWDFFFTYVRRYLKHSLTKDISDSYQIGFGAIEGNVATLVFEYLWYVYLYEIYNGHPYLSANHSELPLRTVWADHFTWKDRGGNVNFLPMNIRAGSAETYKEIEEINRMVAEKNGENIPNFLKNLWSLMLK